ncbi:HmuY family protein [Urechidicola croceus]|uniref:HmuY protein n=1 Tax=Urechidicola croceus TaxID=1850246 RepID=A0A1D8P6H3_9FLAO|nr:HmuY family protein [Urechidicola croceus]AOW20184.1 hypothetical protein LPB138_05590 [Urechidicola croceus]
MKNKLHLLTMLLLLVFTACNDEEDFRTYDPFVVAFDKISIDFSTIQNDEEIQLVFSETAQADGLVTISYTLTDANYGVDFETLPMAVDGLIEIPISTGQSSASFIFKNLIYPFDNEKSVELKIHEIDYPLNNNIQGYSQLLISFETSLGGNIEPEVGGPNQGNQVYVDLSKQKFTAVQRDSWDLGFYGGDNFRVGINGSIYMATKALEFTDIDQVTEDDVTSFQSEVAIGTFTAENMEYVDAVDGNILGTAISEISLTDTENKVYLLNMGYEVGTSIPGTGGVAIAGDHRGWKKIRILRNEENYILQYADLNDTIHQEITISKDSEYNFTFFSLNTESIVNVEPKKVEWDLNFTVFTNEIEGFGSYGYSDFIVSNTKANVQVYQVDTSDITYEDFSESNIDTSSFSDDQRVIGSNWRDVFNASAYDDRFYIVKDTENNIYKIRFTALVNDSGERGFPEFEYSLIQ